ncbi:ATP-binding protein [Novosphingobium panipatense]|uniref:ATP-binding protein n=1 Tax=Novosphingobium panipatense TaxID=428991 RepID=UPI00360D3B40
MSLPATINSQVDPAAVTRVTRLFNNTLGDILSELIQNARRAGASAVDLKVIDADGTAFLAIADDGAGIEDPSVILALGRSGWGDEIARREDPAGMGVFSLAGRDVEIAPARARLARAGRSASLQAIGSPARPSPLRPAPTRSEPRSGCRLTRNGSSHSRLLHKAPRVIARFRFGSTARIYSARTG